MKIKQLQINGQRFNFSNRSTLICSKKNSVGKTTLIRLILYALGYNIPSTKGLNFKSLDLNLDLINDGKDIVIKRKGNKLKVNLLNDVYLVDDLIEDKNTILSLIYGIDIPEVIDNILGTHYFDQEKGWTLLNRGIVIGSIHFNIEKLVEGLNRLDILNLYSKLDELQSKRKIYQELNKLVKLELEYQGKGYLSDSSTEELQGNYKSLNIEINRLNQEIKEYKKIKSDNSRLIDLIEQSGIRVNIDGKEIDVTRKNIVNYDTNQELIDAQLERKTAYVKNYKKQLNALRNQLNEKLVLVNVENELKKLSQFIDESNIEPDNIELIISKMTKEIKKINEHIKEVLHGSQVTISVFNRIKTYAKYLDIQDSIDSKKDFIFTSDLKRYSGAKLHLLVFAFRLALLKEIQNIFNVTIPIILDSPATGEIDENNLKSMFTLLKKEFSNNQLVVASVTNVEKFSKFYDWDNVIELKDRLLNK